MAVKGTWTTGSPPNHLPTILGALALGALLGYGLANHADRPRPAPSPSAQATPAHAPSPSPPRTPAGAIGLRGG